MLGGSRPIPFGGGALAAETRRHGRPSSCVREYMVVCKLGERLVWSREYSTVEPSVTLRLAGLERNAQGGVLPVWGVVLRSPASFDIPSISASTFISASTSVSVSALAERWARVGDANGCATARESARWRPGPPIAWGARTPWQLTRSRRAFATTTRREGCSRRGVALATRPPRLPQQAGGSHGVTWRGEGQG